MQIDTETQQKKLRWPTLEKSQQAVTFSRDLMIVLVFLLLLVFPAFVNDRLVDAGFDEGSFAGLRWKSRVERSNGELTEAKAQISALRNRLKVTQDSLLALQSRSPQIAIPGLAQLRSENARIEQTSGASLRSIQQTISNNERVVSQGTVRGDDDARWVVIFGGDASPEAAADEIQRARELGIPEPRILRRQSSFRSVAIVPSREAAMSVLPNARRVRQDAYAVRLASWCPRLREGDQYGACD
ncbi:MAG TPA: hypothetical protein VEW04_01085 [Allosphingosinicella sp.]|nr:hypothetical protein [Allosphingosinicella sp.]